MVRFSVGAQSFSLSNWALSFTYLDYGIRILGKRFVSRRSGFALCCHLTAWSPVSFVVLVGSASFLDSGDGRSTPLSHPIPGELVICCLAHPTCVRACCAASDNEVWGGVCSIIIFRSYSPLVHLMPSSSFLSLRSAGSPSRLGVRGIVLRISFGLTFPDDESHPQHDATFRTTPGGIYGGHSCPTTLVSLQGLPLNSLGLGGLGLFDVLTGLVLEVLSLYR